MEGNWLKPVKQGGMLLTGFGIYKYLISPIILTVDQK